MGNDLGKQLYWYTMQASDEEFDVQAVESILYLLDKYDPLKKEVIPSAEEAWKQFLAIKDKGELLPVEDACPSPENRSVEEGSLYGGVGETEDEVLNMQSGKTDGEWLKEQVRNDGDASLVSNGAEEGERLAFESEEIGDGGGNVLAGELVAGGKTKQGRRKCAGGRKNGRLAKFTSRHKVIAAAVLLLMVLVVGNTIHAVANPEVGFFFWLKRDETGIKMMTSPEDIDEMTYVKGNPIYSEEDIPEWASQWFSIEKIGLEIPQNYNWRYFEVNELDNRQYFVSCYLDEEVNRELFFGIWVYVDRISYFREVFMDYDYVQSYEAEQKQIDIYRKTEETGKTYYCLSFYEGNYQYYVWGQEDLADMKYLIERYWHCVKENNNF